MHDHVAMAVVHPGEHLLEETARLVLGKLAVLEDVVEQLTARHVLHDEEDVRRRLDDLVAATWCNGM